MDFLVCDDSILMALVQLSRITRRKVAISDDIKAHVAKCMRSPIDIICHRLPTDYT